jgi:hypothetical protein
MYFRSFIFAGGLKRASMQLLSPLIPEKARAVDIKDSSPSVLRVVCIKLSLKFYLTS